jgi:ABC-type branched-subunit amino acid transport system substrate-binding protein
VVLSGLFSPKQPLLFGMSADFSGSNRELGREMQLGIQTCFEDINQAGGIRGRSLQLIALDDRYEPAPAKANMLELISQRGVFAIIGSVGTPTAKASVPVALEHKTLFFGPFTGAGFLRKDPPDRYVFNYRASYEEETAAIVRYFVQIAGIDPTAIAVFSQDDSFGDAGFQGVARTLRDQGVREEDILHVRYQRNQFDTEAAVAGILAAPERARAVVTVSTCKQTTRFISAVRAQRPETAFSCVSFVGTRALAEEFRENDPGMAEGVIITQVVPYFDSGATGVIHYREALARHFPNEQPSFVSLEGYIAAQILVRGLERSKRLETEAVIDALESMRDLDLGTGAVMTFSPSKHQASHKVWAVVMDERAAFTQLSLD